MTDPRFADWYHAAAIDPRQVPLDLRWSGVDEAAAKTNVAAIPELVRSASLESFNDSASRTAFQSRFKTSDPAFLMENNEQELAVLAAATLMQMFSAPSQRADFAASLLRTARFNRWRSVVRDLPATGERYLAARSADLRKVTAPQPPDVDGAGWAASVAAAKTEAAGQTALVTLLTRLEGYVPADAESANKALQAMAMDVGRFAGRIGEEVNILWWLFGERSTLGGRLWHEMPPASVPLTAAVELDGLVTVVPGPVASSQFLARVLDSAGIDLREEVPIADLLSGGVDFVAAEVKGDDGLGSLTPLISGIRSRREGDEAWVGSAERASGISLRQPRARLEIASQFMNELWSLRLRRVLAKE